MTEATALETIQLRLPERGENAQKSRERFALVVGRLHLLPTDVKAGALFENMHDLEPALFSDAEHKQWRPSAVQHFREELWRRFPNAFIDHLMETSECPCLSSEIPHLKALARLSNVTYPDVSKQDNLPAIQEQFKVVKECLDDLPIDETTFSKLLDLVHTKWTPPMYAFFYKGSNAKRQEYREWRTRETELMHARFWSCQPDRYTEHLPTCYPCKPDGSGIGVAIQMKDWMPQSVEGFERAISYLESRFTLTLLKSKKESRDTPWERFEQALLSLLPVQGFSVHYLRHIHSCQKEGGGLCASWAVFDAIASNRRKKLSSESIRLALHGLTRPQSRTILFRSRKGDKNIKIHLGCEMLSWHIARLPTPKRRQELMQMLFIAGTGIDKGRGGLRKPEIEIPSSGLLHRALQIGGSVLSGYEGSIVRHVERRVRSFVQLCTVVWKDNHTYQVRSALCTYGTERVGDGEERCHSAMVSLVDREKEGVRELGSCGLFNERPWLIEMNHTLNLPFECNQIDCLLEDALRRPHLEDLLNRVSGASGEGLGPKAASNEFVRLLKEQLTRLLSSHDGKKFDYIKRHLHALNQIAPGGEITRGFLDFCFGLQAAEEAIDFQAEQKKLLGETRTPKKSKKKLLAKSAKKARSKQLSAARRTKSMKLGGASKKKGD